MSKQQQAFAIAWALASKGNKANAYRDSQGKWHVVSRAQG